MNAHDKDLIARMDSYRAISELLNDRLANVVTSPLSGFVSLPLGIRVFL